MKTALFEYLNADNALTALVADDIYPIIAPQSAGFPRITIQRVSNTHERHLQGDSGLSRAMYQIDSWALNSPSAESVAESVRAALSGFISKLMGTSSPVAVDSIFLIDEDDTIEGPVDGSDAPVFRIRQDYTVNHRESIPTP